MKSLALILALAFSASTFAQSLVPDSAQVRLNVDGVAFFRNNEYDSPYATGYTLPGFRLTPTIEYLPKNTFGIEVGASILHYWGAEKYPIGNYQGIPDFSESDNAKGVHALPYLRAKLHLGNWQFVIGNIINNDCHHLLLPLYDPELLYTADPEAGIQTLFNCRYLDLDVWVDWRTFIYKGSPYREHFLAGISLRPKFQFDNVEVYLPLQALAQHYGGEIDIPENPVVTNLNYAAGLGATVSYANKWLRNFSVEADVFGSKAARASSWLYDKGWAAYVNADALIWNTRVCLGWYHADKFVTMQGCSIWGVLPVEYDPFDGIIAPSTNNMWHASLAYAKNLGYGFSFTAGANAYLAQSRCSYTLEASIRFSPSFLLWQK